MFLERIKYGRYVCNAYGETMNGSNYCFHKNGKTWIGGKHNYRKISFFQYILLSIKYWFLINFAKATYKKMEDISKK